MTWVKQGGNSNLSTDTIWDEETQKEIAGKYLGKKEKTGKMSSDMYVLDVDGKNIGIWGCAVLDNRFNDVLIGELVKIEYLGKETNKNTGRTYKNYDFYKDIREEEIPF